MLTPLNSWFLVTQMQSRSVFITNPSSQLFNQELDCHLWTSFEFSISKFSITERRSYWWKTSFSVRSFGGENVFQLVRDFHYTRGFLQYESVLVQICNQVREKIIQKQRCVDFLIDFFFSLSIFVFIFSCESFSVWENFALSVLDLGFREISSYVYSSDNSVLSSCWIT